MLRLLLFSCILKLSLCACPYQLPLYAKGQCRGYWGTGNAYVNQATSAAASTCSQIKAHPVTMHDDEELSWWSLWIPHPGYLFAIGLTCNTNTNLWEWIDGSPVDFKPPTGKYDKELNEDCKTGCSWFLRTDSSWYINCTSNVVQNTDIYCMAQLEHPVASDDCGNFDDDNDDTVCYQIAKIAETWKDAQDICHSFGAEVASVHNVAQNSYIRRLAVSQGATNGVLLGGTISGKGNDFSWIDGSDWDYTNFYPGFPIEGLGECLTMDTVATAGQWMNTDCATKVPVVCARPYYNSPELAGCLPGPWKEGQIIYSPGFPDDASVPCDYFLTVAAGKTVKLEILLLEANSCCDYVVITDGYVAGPIVANLTGEQSGKFYYTSTSNIMRVSWLPNGGVNVRGLMMSFWAN